MSRILILNNMSDNCYFAEAVATFILVFAGCGAIVVNELFPDTLGHVGVAGTFGLVVMAMVYAVGNISGAHLNPAVTLGFVFAGRLDKKYAFGYIISQIIGAFLAAIVLKLIFAGDTNLGATLPGAEVFEAFVMEVMLTFILMFVILNVSTGHMEKGIMAGVAVGGTIALGALFGGPVSGASMNPARSLAPAVISGELTSLWIYLAAPVLGAFLAFPTCRLVQGPKCCTLDDSAEKIDE